MPKTVTTTDDTLQIFSARELDSNVLARVLKGFEVELGDASTVEGREWIQATLKDGISGFVLAPSARGHTTLGSERKVLVGIALTDNEVQQTPDRLAGVGGWLILLIIGLLAEPFLITFSMPLSSEIWTDPWFFTLAIAGGISSGWSLFVAIALLNRWPTAPKLAQVFLISSCILSIGFVVLLGITTSVNLVAPSIASLLRTVLWVRYLRDSWRVHVTYGPMSPGPIQFSHAATVGITAGIIVCLSTIGIANYRRQVWSEFQSEDGIYKVEAPGSARKSTLADGSMQVLFGNDVRGFVVLESAISQSDTDLRSYFESVRDKAIAAMKGSIMTSSPFSFDGRSGLEFSATFPGKGATGELRGRVYRTGTKGFLLLISGPEGGRTAADAKRFVQSFHIKTSQ